ncbi:hypothetical protein TrCOL_g8761 [Triparma columacea]|uniref:Cytochrome P450 n=1 Tax=Triparma columacea TaxID=722753 RepID=A0A9W7L3U7_9STRA|nr:hypothetical protein TrCOL_g8761 [Triparma columacea]
MYIIYQNHRKRNEPAVVFSFIPVLGSAISFGSDPLHFLRSNTNRLGSTFCAVIAGNRTVFVNDPKDWQEILRLPKSAMNFDDIGKEVLVSSFYMDSGTADAVQFEGSKVLHGQFVKYLQGRDSIRSMTSLVRSSFSSQLSQLHLPPSSPVPLFATFSPLVFKATMTSLFGPDHPLVSDSAYTNFSTHDSIFPLLAGGAPSFLFPSSSSCSSNLRSQVLESTGLKGGLMEARRSYFTSNLGLNPRATAAAQAVIVWASSANTIPSAVWSLAMISNDPVSLARVRVELEGVEGEEGCGGADVDEMTYLDSCIHETLRLASSSLTVRKVNPLGYTLRGGTRLRGGDRVAIFPPLRHMDPLTFPNPKEWVGGRFVDDPALKSRVMPFGGGASKCPGRVFAVREVKVFVASILLQFEVTVVGGTLPDFDKTRVGLGINGIEKGKDVMCILRRRGKRE